ncbi:hypothetical protein AX17_007096 [Amanita inopinata Kibby_2008]|nr:hypothetical protein AX17_007096 [Amanita inopinata Kibby_2008]
MTSKYTGSGTGRTWTPLENEGETGMIEYEGSRSGTSTPPQPFEDTRLLSPTQNDMFSPHPHQQNFQNSARPARSQSAGSFVSSPLNPAATNPFMRPAEPSVSASSTPFGTLSAHQPHHGRLSSRGSMILYRLADDPATQRESLLPPKFASTRNSVVSSSGDSFVSLSSDSKYPSGLPHHNHRGLIPYEYDPAIDEMGPTDDEDLLHDPRSDAHFGNSKATFPWRGIFNVGVLVILIFGLLTLFVFYPVYSFYRNAARNEAINGNIRINATGQAPVLFQMPDLIDVATPASAKSRTGFDGQEYELVFSDEFEVDGRTFYPGDDPYWEAVDLWYGVTGDLEWYDPSQITTRNGSLVITMDSTATLSSNLTPGSTAPFTLDTNHQLQYRSGMLQSWNKFCFTTGYIEVSVTFPGPDENTQGYWPGAWTMGNLARPGYSATTDGMWPYTYDTCDVGTFPNQTFPDHSGPTAALHSDFSRSKYNYELSWLSGQRLSACSCPGGDHPGPVYNKGRGAPEIDVFETQKDKVNPTGQRVSQSAQFAPFTHDYIYGNTSNDQFQIFDDTKSVANPYRGSAVQQAISSLVRVPSDMFQGSGQVFRTLGFEYWSDPKNRDQGFVTWQVDGTPSYRLGASAVPPDQGDGGTGVGQRLVPEEPMSIILNLGISPNWQKIDLSTMIFPAEMKVEYVRVYQRKGQTNVGCDPKDYPTADYINNHLEAYTNPNKTTWDWPKPQNSLYARGC